MDTSTVQEIATYHLEHLKSNPRHTQKQTGDHFDLNPKTICMILKIYACIHEPEVRKRRGLKGMYAVTLKLKRDQNQKHLKRLLT